MFSALQKFVLGTGSALSLGVLALSMPANAQDTAPQTPTTDLITPEMISEIRDMMSAPIVVAAVRDTNETRKGLTQAEIDEMDLTWREERDSSGAQPYIASALASPLSTYLLRRQAASKGLYNEIFVMDMHGLNVGQSSVTSDFWQGDEAKFLKTVPKGAGTVFIDDVEYNEEFGIWIAQVNITLDENGEVIGSSTVEVNLTELERRMEMGL